MHKLKLVWQSLVQTARRVWWLPQSFADAFKQRQQQLVLDKNEAERLDRIRNPSKYLGK